MKKFILKSISVVIILIVGSIGVLLAADKLFFPWYVDRPEHVVPDVTGMHKDEAIKLLNENKLNYVLEGPKYDSRFSKDHVILQNPLPGKIVKENRRVYLFISGGDPLIKMPSLVGKTKRDAKISVERLGLVIDTLMNVRSEFPSDLVVEQIPEEGEKIPKGSGVSLSISVGPRIGMIRVPPLLGKSLKEGTKLLRNNSLRLGKINYMASPNWLPNTIIDQYPSEDKLVNVGDSVDVLVTKNNSN